MPGGAFPNCNCGTEAERRGERERGGGQHANEDVRPRSRGRGGEASAALGVLARPRSPLALTRWRWRGVVCFSHLLHQRGLARARWSDQEGDGALRANQGAPEKVVGDEVRRGENEEHHQYEGSHTRHQRRHRRRHRHGRELRENLLGRVGDCVGSRAHRGLRGARRCLHRRLNN